MLLKQLSENLQGRLRLKFLLMDGFVISSMEISEVFGTLIHLAKFHHPKAQKVFDFRTGYRTADGDIRKWFRL